jgi:hypothetical protein
MLISGLGAGVSSAQGSDTRVQEIIFSLGFVWATVWWLRLDSRRHNVTPPYCAGMLMSVAWPIVLISHLYQTRGARAFLFILGYIAVVAAVYVLSLVFYFLSGGELPG